MSFGLLLSLLLALCYSLRFVGWSAVIENLIAYTVCSGKTYMIIRANLSSDWNL